MWKLPTSPETSFSAPCRAVIAQADTLSGDNDRDNLARESCAAARVTLGVRLRYHADDFFEPLELIQTQQHALPSGPLCECFKPIPRGFQRLARPTPQKTGRAADVIIFRWCLRMKHSSLGIHPRCSGSLRGHAGDVLLQLSQGCGWIGWISGNSLLHA